MLLKVGELAKRAGLTVRALHHYNRIGLLNPSARSEAGYRLYNRDDIARLHQIQALQRLGLSLSEVQAVLHNPTTQLPDVIAQQLDMLSKQIAQTSRLRERLTHLQQQLKQGEEPDLGDWLTTLELMNMHDKYFTPDEIKRLPKNFANQHTNPEWAALVKRVQQLMHSNTPTNTDAARATARDWFAQVERDISGDPVLLAKLTQMHAQEPAVQQQSGATTEMVSYIQQASIHDKLDIYEKYLNADEFAFVKANYGKRINEWPPLIADAYQAMQSGQPATSPETLAIARRWMDLSGSYTGDNSDTLQKIRIAHEREPDLLKGSLITNELLSYMREAFMALHRR
jgi:MerR family transcriptional regulator, thiopeptide resistance regulator